MNGNRGRPAPIIGASPSVKVIRPSRAHLLALLLGLLLALPAAWLLSSRINLERGWRLAFHEVDVPELLREVRAGTGLDRGELLFRPALSERAVGAMVPLNPERRIYDPDCYFVYPPGSQIEVRFPEHPQRTWTRPVNSLGLRDADEWQEGVELAVLVAGDSHVDGVCPDEETLPSRLGEQLQLAGIEAQTLNAAHGGYTFYHHVGVLQRFLARGLVPDVLVVVVYGGNDFSALPPMYELFHGRQPPGAPPPRIALRNRILKELRHEMGQAGNAIEYFASRPELTHLALRVACDATLELRQLCESQDVELIVAYLPSALELGRGTDLSRSHEMLRRLGRGPQDIERVTELGRSYITFLEEQEIRHLDLLPLLSEEEGLLYWKTDLHLAPRGHEAAALALAPVVLEALAGEQRR